ncbi:MAG: DNA-binding domain-containing protein [Rhodocyclaceae bacterium]|nr:DNA-binding domain-containing protein [Rhodocyclaceae bacterium]
MNSLRSLQQDFCLAIFNEKKDDILLRQHCVGSATRVRAGIATYRRSILANLANAVVETYPLLQNILGIDFVQEAARVYAIDRLSHSGDLNAYGGDFSGFLACYSPAREYPWLPAVADMEWRIQLIYGAKDAPALNLSAFQSVPPEQWEALKFGMDPGHALIKSDWPLGRIWEVNQPGYSDDMRVEFNEPQSILLHRKGFDTAVDSLTQGEFDFLSHLSQGDTLGQAVESAVYADENFDFQATLQRFIGSSLIRTAFLSETS